MAERYKLPDALGGGELEATEYWSGCAGARAEYEFAGGYKIVAPIGERFTPVKSPTPPEPEPGPYMVGDWYAVHARTNRDKRWGIVGYPSIDWVDWEEFLDFVGPDATITRLVPERVETVELPWQDESLFGTKIVVEQADDGQIAVDFNAEAQKAGVLLDAAGAVRLSHALLAASRAES